MKPLSKTITYLTHVKKRKEAKKMQKINKLMFREYDIRGIYGEDLTTDVAYYIGRAFATKLTELHKPITIVGHDNRLSSEPLNKELIKGITEGGIDVIDLGLVTTPMYYSAWDFLKIPCGIMITASHNPKEYNGFKFSYNGIHNAYGPMVMELYNIIERGEFTNGNGQVTHQDITQSYLQLLLKDLTFGPRPLKVVYDCGNGTTSIIANDVFNKLPFTSIPLFAESDPNFPNHHPDPCVEDNLSKLKAKVKEEHADIGVAYDGDGDRIGIVDEKGEMVETDKFMIIIWRDIYHKVTNKKALYDVKCTKALEDELIKLNIAPTCYRTGNSYTKAKVVEGDYPFGGEYSGHVYFRDRWPGYDDGIYASLRMLEILSNTDKTVSQLLEGINKYYATKELKIHVDDNKKEDFINQVKENSLNKKYHILTIDGIKVLFDDGFALIRASNTGPNITYRYEARSQKRLTEIQEEFNNLINKIEKE